MKRTDILAGTKETTMKLISAFSDLYPETEISPHFPEGDEILPDVEKRTARGLGPDLMLTRSTIADDLINAGLTRKIKSSTLNIKRSNPALYSSYEDNGDISGVPVVLLPQIACYNTNRISSSPNSINELINLAASGIPIGLPIDIRDNFWTTTGRAAQEVMFNLFSLGNDEPGQATDELQQQALIDWLQWLRHINLQKNISFFQAWKTKPFFFRSISVYI